MVDVDSYSLKEPLSSGVPIVDSCHGWSAHSQRTSLGLQFGLSTSYPPYPWPGVGQSICAVKVGNGRIWTATNRAKGFLKKKQRIRW